MIAKNDIITNSKRKLTLLIRNKSKNVATWGRHVP